MVCEDNGLIEKLSEKLLEREKDLEFCRSDLQSWTEALGGLSKIKDAFTTEKELNGKTILDIGTDCVKPLYIALKFKPNKIIGINEKLPSFASDLETESRLFTDTEIRFHDCSFFDDETFKSILKQEKILKEEKIDRFDFILLSKTLHHLRTGKCIADKRNEKHKKLSLIHI